MFGEPCFDYLAKHPEDSAVFNEGMTGFSSRVAPAVAEAYDFSKFGTVVDVGGGHGVMLATILKAYPEASAGVVFDAPHVADGAHEPIRAAGLADRCRAEGGDFFKAVPAGGDAYLMKHIIHDWPDDKATTILKNCRKAVKPGGKLCWWRSSSSRGTSRTSARSRPGDARPAERPGADRGRVRAALRRGRAGG